MKVNSELPVSLLSHNNELNEYDFVLYHLYISNKPYREYFKKQRVEHPERLMILDNSAYEFFIQKKKFSEEQFVQVIKQLRPDFYILPDTLMNFSRTTEESIDFERRFGSEIYSATDHKSLPLAVIQGNSEDDLIKCLKLYKRQCLCNIAVPFHNRFFSEMKVDKDIIAEFKQYHGTSKISEDMHYALGRVQFVRNNRDVLQKGIDHIHFLGSHDPFEKHFYRGWFSDNIPVTMDTGYPVKIALSGWELGKTVNKPNVILDEFLDKEIDGSILELIKSNVIKFREL